MEKLGINPDGDNAVQAILRAGGGLVDPVPIATLDGSKAIVVPEGYYVHEFKPTDKPLTRISCTPRMDDAASFIAYVNRFKVEASVLFADLKANTITAIFDYHQASHPENGKGIPDYTQHRAVHPCPWSVEWARWRAVDGQKMTQKALGNFLEEMLHTIAEPDGAGLIEIAAELRVEREVKFKSGTRLQDGTLSIAYEETDQTSGKKGKIVVPDEITIACPIFMGGEAQAFRAKLRYALDRGDLTFKIDVLNRIEGEQAAFQKVVAQVGDGTGRPVFYGAP